jgi:hypothetical protein
MKFKSTRILLLLGLAGSAQAATVIQNVTATATSGWDDHLGEASHQWVGNLTNNSGLSVPYDISATHEPHNSAYGMWHAKAWAADPNPTLTFDLGDAYHLSGIHIWNGNQALNADHIKRGVYQFQFYVSTDGGANYSMVDTFELAVSPLPGGPIAAQSFDLGGIEGVTHARIRVLSTHNSPAGGGDYASLSEVMFTTAAIPEPTTLLTGCLGFLAFARRRRGQVRSLI